MRAATRSSAATATTASAERPGRAPTAASGRARARGAGPQGSHEPDARVHGRDAGAWRRRGRTRRGNARRARRETGAGQYVRYGRNLPDIVILTRSPLGSGFLSI